MSNNLKATLNFHGYLDTELASRTHGSRDIRESRHLIIQERDISYRLSPHFHPYVRQLGERLLRKSTAGMQAADTEYEARNVSLPGSVEIAAGENVGLSLPAGASFTLLED